jgi:hypothetical protein
MVLSNTVVLGNLIFDYIYLKTRFSVIHLGLKIFKKYFPYEFGFLIFFAKIKYSTNNVCIIHIFPMLCKYLGKNP